ncbi:MAG: DNA adenine methylase [Clostridia bacterium]|jgi:adenine-specific DNA-methyltransferase
MIKYLGSKRKLIPDILDSIKQYSHYNSILDVFSGTARCSYAFKQTGLKVISNDHNVYAHTVSTCYIEANKEDVQYETNKILNELNNIHGKKGWFTETYCYNSRFFQPKNGEKIDAIRDKIEELNLARPLKQVVLTSLLEAADRVDSTCGIQMAYIKNWSARSNNDLILKLPKLLPQPSKGKCISTHLDANEVVQQINTDITYLDPPYNQHSYLSNYHIWESLVLWDKPAVYGIACKRIDCKTRKSAYNSKVKHKKSFQKLIEDIKSKIIIVSFNNEGFISKQEMESLLLNKGKVTTITKDYNRYIGAKIGIYNPSGEKVGKIKSTKNKEYIYICEV